MESLRHSGWYCRLTVTWKTPANASVPVWILKCTAALPVITCFFRLEGAAVNIFSMSHLYYQYDNFDIINTINNSVNSLAYTIPVVAG